MLRRAYELRTANSLVLAYDIRKSVEASEDS